MAAMGILTNAVHGLNLGNLTTNSSRSRDLLSRISRRIHAAASGTGRVVTGYTVLNNATGTAVFHRAAAVVIPATSGSATVVINGTSVTADFATSASVTASAAAAGINGDATASSFVSAHQYVGKLTTASAVAGDAVSILGVTFTAQSSAATLGTEQWDIRTSDTAAGLSLATQINSHPNLANKCFAVNSAGVVYVALLENRAARSDETFVVKSGSTVTINSQILTTSGLLAVIAHMPGKLGNCCTLTVTGTGSSAVSLVSGKLGGGLGGDALSQVIESTQR